ncbi:MAG: hypothetical protein D6718_02950 [Acidobacteria bacterium]|nr:MAG: hypothetical protein D6718_02950 [Acidobacteriota bacterium]
MGARPRRFTEAVAVVPVALLLGVAAGGCVSPLRQPAAPLEASTRAGRSDPAELERQARELWDLRPDLDAVRRAAQAWLDAAALDPRSARCADRLAEAVRAHVWLAEHEESAAAREAAAARALDAARHCRERFPDRIDCEYWFAVALGVTARERPATAGKSLALMIEALERVAEREPALEQAGPHRVLALVYLRAPGWPAGPGDEEAGLEHARKAVALAPDFPPNVLALAEALDRNGDAEGARETYERAREQAENWAARGHPDAPAWREEAERALRRLGGAAPKGGR